MDSTDVMDDVNALLKLDVGDSYRLEHIKQAYLQNKTIWITDSNYLQQMKEKYLTKLHSDTQTDVNENLENDSESGDVIHCWKCGKKTPLGANFCMICGSSLFDVGTRPQTIPEKIPSVNLKNHPKTIGLKIPVIVGIPVLVLILFTAVYGQGFSDDISYMSSSDDSIDDTIATNDSVDKEIPPTEINSKCGAGTLFDPDTNSCVLAK